MPTPTKPTRRNSAHDAQNQLDQAKSESTTVKINKLNKSAR